MLYYSIISNGLLMPFVVVAAELFAQPIRSLLAIAATSTVVVPCFCARPSAVRVEASVIVNEFTMEHVLALDLGNFASQALIFFAAQFLRRFLASASLRNTC